MFFKAKSILDKIKLEYTITRENQTIENGMPIDITETFNTYLTITSAKKEDMDSMGTGNFMGGLLKIKILEDEDNQVKLGDKFEFDGGTYKITRKRPYQTGITDFKIFFAGLEGN